MKTLISTIIAMFWMKYANFAFASVSARFENIIKSPIDHRAYRGLILNNDLKVLLISDPSTEMAATYMDTGIGALNDLPDVPGIANFVGYAVTKASKGHPKPWNFTKFVELHNGSVLQQITQTQDQKFGFSIKPGRLAAALDRFAEFFLEPLLCHSPEKTFLDDIIALVEADYLKSLIIDDYRVEQVEKSVCKKKHLYCHLFSGSIRTLFQHTDHLPESELDAKTVLLYEKACLFHSTWYSSNLMSLAVLGKENLDDLEKMVVPLFKNIVNKKRKKLMHSYANHPWGPAELKHKIYVVPINRIQIMRLNFPVPDIHQQYKTAPELYIRNLIENPRPGSLLSVLRVKDLCTDIKIQYSFIIGMAFFNISCALTNNGFGHVDDIVHLIFQYIYLINSDQGIQEWIFNEQKQELEIGFHNAEFINESPLNYVKHLCFAIQYYPFEDVLTYKYFVDQWEPSLIKEFLSFLRPDKMKYRQQLYYNYIKFLLFAMSFYFILFNIINSITIVSKSSQKFADREEENHRTLYGLRPIPTKLIERWSTKDSDPEVQLPPPKDIMPENFDVYPVNENEPKYPHIIHESAITEIWFKHDDKFKVPTLEVIFNLYSSQVQTGPGDQILIHIFRDRLRSSLKTYFHSAEQAGYRWEIFLGSKEIRVSVHGYSDKLHIFLEKLLIKMTNLEDDILVNENYFRTTLQKYLRKMKTSITTEPIYQLESHLQNILTNGWTAVSIFNAGNLLQYNDMKKFVSKLFRRIFIRGLIHGNCTKERAMDIVNIIERAFHSSNGMLMQEISWPRVVVIPDKIYYTYQSFNEKYVGLYGYNAYFQLHTVPYDLKNNMASALFHLIVKKSCLNILEDSLCKQKPIVKCMLYTTHGVRGFIIQVIAEKDLQYIDRKVEKFMRNIPDIIKTVDKNELEQFKKRVEESESLEPSNLNELTSHYFYQILYREYNFDKNEKALQQLHSIQRVDVVNYVKDMLLSSNLRKVMIHVLPNSTRKMHLPQGSKKIEDTVDLRMVSSLFPYDFHLIPTNSQK